MPQSLSCSFLFAMLAILVLPLSAVAQDKTTPSPLESTFVKINGESFSYRQFLRMLSRQTIQLPDGKTANALHYVLDELVANQIVLKEATKNNIAPTEDEVNRYYATEQKLYEAQNPGGSFEDGLLEQGLTPQDKKVELKYELAETNLYAKKLSVTDKDLRTDYDQSPATTGLPARVQLRLILVAPESEDMKRAIALFLAKTPFSDVARQVNPPSLRVTAGLVARTIPLSTLATPYKGKIEKAAEGDIFGPVDYQLSDDQPKFKAWMKVERKFPSLILSYEDAVPILKRSLAVAKLAGPAYRKVPNEIVLMKLNAILEPTEPDIARVWDQLKKNAQANGLGETEAPSAP
jgi:hypothetical protein